MSELSIGDGGPVLVAQTLIDLQRLAIPLLRRFKVTTLLGDPPRLVVGDGGPVLIAQTLLDLQRLAIPLLRRFKVTTLLGDHPQLVEGTRLQLFVTHPSRLSLQLIEEDFSRREVARILRERGQ